MFEKGQEKKERKEAQQRKGITKQINDSKWKK